MIDEMYELYNEHAFYIFFGIALYFIFFVFSPQDRNIPLLFIGVLVLYRKVIGA